MLKSKDINYVIEEFIKERRTEKSLEKEHDKPAKKIRSQENLEKGRQKITSNDRIL